MHWLRALCLSSCLLGSSLGATESDASAEAKALMIRHLLEFTAWPVDSLPEQAVLRIGLLGKNKVTDYIYASLHGRLMADHPVEVRYLTLPLRDDPTAASHLLYITPDIVDELSIAPLSSLTDNLVVSDSEAFAERGGMVALVSHAESQPVKLRINTAALQQSRITLDAMLLQVVSLIAP